MNKEYRKAAWWLLFSFLAGMFSSCAGGWSPEAENERYTPVTEYVTWRKADGSRVTIENRAGTEKSQYAWYLLDEQGERLETVWYQNDNQITFDLSENPNGAVRAFVKTGEETNSVLLTSEELLTVQSFAVDAPETLVCDPAAVEIMIGGESSTAIVEEGIYMGYDVSLPLSERAETIEDRTLAYRIASFIYLDEVYSAWKESGDRRCAEEIKERILEWVDAHGEIDLGKKWAWHDDATARRVCRMSFYLWTFSDLFTKEEYIAVRESLAAQAALLASDAFYTKNHNHGMFQDIGLAVYAVFLGSSEEKEVYLSRALTRTGSYLDASFTPDGVHKEHSPEYAQEILTNLMVFTGLVGQSAPAFTVYVGTLTKNAESVLVQFIKPDGMLPSVGDSRVFGADDLTFSENEELTYVLTSGKEGCAPPRAAVYTEGGYAMLRSSWDDDPADATWMLFSAATFSSVHKHSDDLQVLLYHKGDLFTEGGKRDYNYDNPQTAWCYSGYAHNVLFIDGEDFPTGGNRQILPAALETRITEACVDGQTPYVTGIQKRFEGVEQERTLRYDLENARVTISDRIVSEEAHRASLLFHVAHGVAVTALEDGWRFSRNGQVIAEMRVSSSCALALTTIEGEGEGNLCAWEFSGNLEAEQGVLLEISWELPAGESSVETGIDLK